MANFPFDIVGFDLDGTLVDTHGDLGDALNHALQAAGRSRVPMDAVKGLVGGGSKRLLARALDLTGGGIEDAEFARLHDLLVDYYEANICVHSRLFAGGEDALDTLEGRGVKLAVATNKLERLAVKLLSELGLSKRFYTILGGDTLGAGKAKPAPDMLRELISRGGGGRAVYVGDSSFDTRASTAAGIPCVAVRFGFSDKPLHELRTAAIIEHFDELVGAIEGL